MINITAASAAEWELCGKIGHRIRHCIPAPRRWQAGGARRSARAASVERTMKRAAEHAFHHACAGFVIKPDMQGSFNPVSMDPSEEKDFTE